MSLGHQLNFLKQSVASKSSILHEDMDEKKLVALIEDRDKTIRDLNKRIKKAEDSLKRALKDKGQHQSTPVESQQDNMHLNLLKTEIAKTKRLEEIIEDITQRVTTILQDLSLDKTITDNTEEIRLMLRQMEASHSESLSQDFMEFELQKSFSISSEWAKKVDLLESAIRSMRGKFSLTRQNNEALIKENETLRAELAGVRKGSVSTEEARQLTIELKEEKKQRQRMKKLLEKAQFEKNELINRINAAAMKDSENVKAKTKEELVQYSKQLQYRVIDLEKERDSILKEQTKDKQQDLKKYQEFLKKLKVIKEKSIIGKTIS